jgi:fimbrial chaperone protein
MKYSCYRPFPLSKSFYCLIVLFFLVAPALAEAGWRVVPIRLDFDQRTRSGVITLANDGDASITFAIEASQWTQDEQGNDQYSATEDLVFFPKMLTIEPNKERVVRAGIRVPATTLEKTYRLFIKEASEPKKAEGTTVAVAIRFGVPIFVIPLKEEITGEMQNLYVKGGLVGLTVANTGNGHFRIGTVRVTGVSAAEETIFEQEVNGWYLLAGSTRDFSIPIPEELCSKLKSIKIHMNADRLYLEKQLDVNPGMCAAE